MSTFSELQNDAPKLPPFTCPKIDAAIEAAKSAFSDLDELTGKWGPIAYAREEGGDANFDKIEQSVRSAQDHITPLYESNYRYSEGRVDAVFEQIRTANSGLREAAEYWEEAAEKLGGELDAANQRIAELEAQLAELSLQEAA